MEKNDSVKQIFEINNRNNTPDHIKKYRKSYLQQIGTTILHPGSVNHYVNHKDKAYGIKTIKNDSVNGCLNHKTNNIVDKINEEIYKSNKDEKLGKKPDYNYVFPDVVNDSDFKFGLKTKDSDNTVKDILDENNGNNISEKEKELYKKSHKNYAVGEQKTYNYNNNFDKNNNFGKAKVINENIKQCLTQDNCNNTKIINNTVTNFKNYNDDIIGKPKNLLQNKNLNYVKKDNKEDIKDCFKSNLGDLNDIGKCTTIGKRNIVKAGDEDRAFGVPSSNLNTKKGGNIESFNSKAIEVIFPNTLLKNGISEDDYFVLRKKNEIFDIFLQSGFNYNRGKLEGIWLRALNIENNNNLCSVDSFLKACKELHYI